MDKGPLKHNLQYYNDISKLVVLLCLNQGTKNAFRFQAGCTPAFQGNSYVGPTFNKCLGLDPSQIHLINIIVYISELPSHYITPYFFNISSMSVSTNLEGRHFLTIKNNAMMTKATRNTLAIASPAPAPKFAIAPAPASKCDRTFSGTPVSELIKLNKS